MEITERLFTFNKAKKSDLFGKCLFKSGLNFEYQFSIVANVPEHRFFLRLSPLNEKKVEGIALAVNLS